MKRNGFTLIEIIIVISILAILVGLLTPHWVRALWRGQLSACVSNQKNLATALSIYATQQPEFEFPTDMNRLVPDCMKYLPNCPTDAGKSGYTYEVYNVPPLNFTIRCKGDHATLGVPATYPYYSLARGVVERP